MMWHEILMINEGFGIDGGREAFLSLCLLGSMFALYGALKWCFEADGHILWVRWIRICFA